MASFLGGVIPTVTVFPNSTANQLATGLISNAAESVVRVAINEAVGSEWLQSLGIDPLNTANLAQNIINPGIINVGSQLINRAITDGLKASPALAPLGSLLSNAATGVLNQVGQNLLGDLFGFGSKPTRYFPGAGNEPESDYEGFAYNNAGRNSKDVVFSIVAAASSAQEELSFSPSFAASLAAGESLNLDVAGLDLSSGFDSVPNAFSSKTGFNLETLGGQVGSPEFFSDASAIIDNVESFSEGAYNVGSNFDGSVPFGAPKPPPRWTFICAPEDVSWDTAAQVDRIQIFGTNAPPVISGSKGMRDLSLSNALVEGFSRGKSVEDKIAQLEAMMNVSISESSYVSVPVYRVMANDKIYGDGDSGIDGGYFVIRDIKVKETMRDLTGKATRATVDITFTQVPYYQVMVGRDSARKAVTGAVSILKKVEDKVDSYVNQLVEQGILSQEAKESRKKSKDKSGGSGVSSQANQGVDKGRDQIEAIDPTFIAPSLIPEPSP